MMHKLFGPFTGIVALAGIAGPLIGTSAAPAQTVDPVQPSVNLEAEPFDLSQVRLLDGPFREAMLRDQSLLAQPRPGPLALHLPRNAGLPSTAQP